MRLPLWLLSALVLLVAVVAVRNAAAWYGRPIPGVLLDPGGSVSSIGMPDWQGKQLGLSYPQSIVPAETDNVTSSRARTQAWDRAVAERTTRGFIEARVEGPQGTRLVSLRLQPLEPLAWWVYGGSLMIAGLLYAGAGLIALWASPRGKLARTFAVFAVSSGLFLLSLFDVHTQRSLAPLFFLTFPVFGVTLPLLAMRLPDDTALLARFPIIEPLVYAVGVTSGIGALLVYATGGDTRAIGSAFSAIMVLGYVFFIVAFIARYARARGARQDVLRPLLLSMVPPYAAIAIGMSLVATGAFGSSLKSIVDILSFPAILFAPLACLYAFVKHDLWGSRALLSRIGTHVVLGAVACIAAIAAGAALAGSIGLSFQAAMAGAGASTILAIALTAVARRVSDSTLFASRAEYKPTIEQLSAELLTITSPNDVARAIERTVTRWLPCDSVHLTLEKGSAEHPGNADSGQSLASSDASAELRMRVDFGERTLAWLDVGKKRGGALFTTDDVDLLRTITNQGALAIAHARAYQELEQRRQQQAQAWRGEREALVETVAAEIAHEIRYPINFFRSIFERSAQGTNLETDDVDVGREEVDRLERLVAGLKRMATHRLERAPVAIGELCARAEALLRDTLGERTVVLDVDA